MNRIVREHYPVSRLPEDIRNEFQGQHEVTLIMQDEAPLEVCSGTQDDEAALSRLKDSDVRGGDSSRFEHLRRAHFQSPEGVEARMDALRGEWAHRER